VLVASSWCERILGSAGSRRLRVNPLGDVGNPGILGEDPGASALYQALTDGKLDEIGGRFETERPEQLLLVTFYRSH
jgi:hypothetical protein